MYPWNIARDFGFTIADPQMAHERLRIPDGSKLIADNMRKAMAINDYFEKRLTVFRKEPLISCFEVKDNSKKACEDILRMYRGESKEE